MTAFDDLYAEVKKDVPSCPDALIKQQAFMTVNDFCQYTNIWQENITIPIVAGTSTYTLTVADGKINRLMFVYDANAPTKNWPQSGIAMRVPGTLELYRAPQQNGSWVAIVAKRPFNLNVDGWPVIDEWIIDKYEDWLAAGTTARIVSTPQKPYTNPIAARDNQRTYIEGRSLARANDGYGNIYNAAGWRYPQGWTVSRTKGWV